MPHLGSCLCGSVKITITSNITKQLACHCSDCNKTSGTAFSSNIFPKVSEIEITGDTHEYSSIGLTRIFCPGCGSAIGHKTINFGDRMAIQTGNFPDLRDIPFDQEIFVNVRWAGIPQIPDTEQSVRLPPSYLA
ncbi:uncharacterized protein L201_001046 [Kwoniella dendrophila CBS 6074]|uniref:CENP-V/GFA domain-containing protein n=1 Tax=Kwoniella dendrophila CBS 6074 TaxID=1295534 RepID=A0AAX4JP04_9TREE